MSGLLWVGIGGACGACARYLIGRWAIERFGASFPVGTLMANVTGCLLIGVIMAILMARSGSETPRLFLVVGVLGGYTTFSAFAYESITLIEQGKLWRAGTYIALSNAAGLIACGAGWALTRLLTR